MTAFNARTDSFVTLLLNVSGRARPSDIQGVSPAEALEVLQAYAAAHAAEGVRFDGDSLVMAAMPPSGPPTDVAFQSPPTSETPFVEPQPAAAPATEQLPSWMFEGEIPSPAAPEPAPVAASIPEHESALFEGASASQPAVLDQVEDDGPISNDFVNLPPLEGAAEADSGEPARKGTSPLLLVLLVVLLLVAAVAAAYYLGALELLGLNIG